MWWEAVSPQIQPSPLLSTSIAIPENCGQRQLHTELASTFPVLCPEVCGLSPLEQVYQSRLGWRSFLCGVVRQERLGLSAGGSHRESPCTLCLMV